MQSRTSPYRVIDGGICAAEGFSAHAVACGIKNPTKLRLDLALVHADSPCSTAAARPSARIAPRCIEHAARRGPGSAERAGSGHA